MNPKVPSYAAEVGGLAKSEQYMVNTKLIAHSESDRRPHRGYAVEIMLPSAGTLPAVNSNARSYPWRIPPVILWRHDISASYRTQRQEMHARVTGVRAHCELPYAYQ